MAGLAATAAAAAVGVRTAGDRAQILGGIWVENTVMPGSWQQEMLTIAKKSCTITSLLCGNTDLGSKCMQLKLKLC